MCVSFTAYSITFKHSKQKWIFNIVAKKNKPFYIYTFKYYNTNKYMLFLHSLWTYFCLFYHGYKQQT